MPRIEKVELPPAEDGSVQWYRVHRRPTHGQVKAIAAVWGDPGSQPMDVQTVCLQQLVTEALIKDDEGREIPWNGTGPDEQGIGATDVPQDLVTAMFDEAVKGVADAFPGIGGTGGNRAGRRQAARSAP